MSQLEIFLNWKLCLFDLSFCFLGLYFLKTSPQLSRGFQLLEKFPLSNKCWRTVRRTGRSVHSVVRNQTWDRTRPSSWHSWFNPQKTAAVISECVLRLFIDHEINKSVADVGLESLNDNLQFFLCGYSEIHVWAPWWRDQMLFRVEQQNKNKSGFFWHHSDRQV